MIVKITHGNIKDIKKLIEETLILVEKETNELFTINYKVISDFYHILIDYFGGFDYKLLENKDKLELNFLDKPIEYSIDEKVIRLKILSKLLDVVTFDY